MKSLPPAENTCSLLSITPEINDLL
jgi:hypothetical protein